MAGALADQVAVGEQGIVGVMLESFLLAGRLPWRRLLRPAIVTALLWIGLELFSSVYFSSSIISDSRLYGTIGVIFSLITWFIAIGAVIVLGAVAGATWDQRKARPADTRS